MSVWELLSSCARLFSAARRVRRGLLPVEGLEDRTLLSINIVYDFTYDTSGFFADYERQATLEAVAQIFEDAISDNLSAIVPGGVNTWTASFPHPGTGATVQLTNPSIATDEFRVYLGARPLAGSTIGFASSAWSASGTSPWLATVQYRGQTATSTEYANWGGSITFDSENTWHTGVTTVGLGAGESDLYSTAIHELAHLLGYGGDSWDFYSSGGTFTGPVSVGVYGSPVPTTGGHWADGVMNDGREVALSPIGSAGARAAFTTLDWAGLDDIGWSFNPSTAPAGHLVLQVVDASGMPVVGANVSGTRTGGGTFGGVTDANGLYSQFVNDGSWTVVVEGDSETVAVNKGMQGVRLVRVPTINGDDVFVRDANTGTFWLGYSNGTSFTETFGGQRASGTDWEFVHADFNGDGKVDIASRLISAGTWFVELYDVPSLSGPWGQWDTTKLWTDVHAGDFNGDGKADIAGRDQNGYWTIAYSNGSSFSNTAAGRWAATGWLNILHGDFNGDGRADIAGRQNSGDWYFGLSDGTKFITTRAGKWSSAGGWSDIVAGDFDGDGKDDLAGKTSGGYWWIAKSNGTMLTNSYSGVRWSPTAGFYNVLVGDFNGDGKADVAGRAASGSWFINVGQSVGNGFKVSSWGTWTNTLTFYAVVGDFNGDGRDDLAGFVPSNRNWYVLQSNGTRFISKNFGRWAAGFSVDYLGAGPVN